MAKVLKLKVGGYVRGPMISKCNTTARLQFGLHYRDGRARGSASGPIWGTAEEFRAYAAWLLDVAATLESLDLKSGAECAK